MRTRLLIAVVVLSVGCKSLPVTVKTWPATETNRTYPELGDSPYKVSWIEQRKLGIAVSGGGTRAAAAALGQLRALQCLGWIDQASHISAVSGGSWTAVPFTYLPRRIDDEHFLGTYVSPKAMTMDTLAVAPEQSLTRAINGAFPFLRALTHMVRARGDESFAASLGDIFLRPFGLGDRSKFFSFHEAALKETLSRNRDLDAADFLLPEKERPYLVVGATLIGKPKGGHRKNFFPVDLTPLYSGMAPREPDPLVTGRWFGGGFVESLAYDSKLARQQPPGDLKAATIDLQHYRFTLSDVIASSGAAPQATLVKYLIDNIGFPEYRQWPIDASHGERETHFGDGGHVENIGLMPLLARKVPNILVFINTASPFRPELNEQKKYPLYGDLIHFFRDPKTDETPDRDEVMRQGEEVADVDRADPTRIVIENGPQKLKELADAFRIRKGEGRPLVHCDGYKIKNNPRFSVSDYDASICWVYLDKTEGWVEQLDRKVARRVAKRNFPHYATFFARGAAVIRLRPPDVNALSNLTAWTVFSEKETIAKELGGLPLPEGKCEP